LRFLGGFKKDRRLLIVLSSVLLLVAVSYPIVLFAQKTHLLISLDKEAQGTPVGLQLPGRQSPLQLPEQSGMATPKGQKGAQQPVTSGPPSGPSTPGSPTLDRLEQVTDQAFGDGTTYVPNSWGQHKNRIIRTSTGDIFTVFISEGTHLHRTWHLMHRSPNGGWQEIKTGDAGEEPINIVRGPNDEIHIIAFPGTQGQVEHFESTDLGKTWTSEMLPGQWSTDQGYIGADVNAQGDIVVVQTGNDIPGTLYWCYYSPASGKWQFHTTDFPIRYTYNFAFPDANNGITIVGMRDALRNELGYPDAGGGFDYIFNQIKYFYISNANSSNPTVTQQAVVAQQEPQSNTDADITYMTDSYMDTLGRVHILYFDLYDNLVHHVILKNGDVIKEVKLNIDYGDKARVFQDALGHFYIISTSQDGNSLNIYPGTASDTDGTLLNPPVSLNISQLPGCSDYDFCHSPNLTIQRSGHALSNYIDGVYGNHTKEIYFRIKLR